MKKTSLFAVLFAVLFVIVARSGTINTTLLPTTLAGTPALFVTNYSSPVIVGYMSFSAVNPTFVVNQAGLNTTNSITNYVVFGTSTNISSGTIVYTNSFPVTNAGAIQFVPNTQKIPVYGWTQTITTNSTLVWQTVNTIP